MICKYTDKVTFVLEHIELAVEEGNDGKFPRGQRRAEHQEMPSRKWEGRLSILAVVVFFFYQFVNLPQKFIRIVMHGHASF